MQAPRTHLWFDDQGEQAARYWCSLLPDSEVTDVKLFPPGEGQPTDGDVRVTEFTLMGQRFTALDAGKAFKLDPAFSILVPCENQEEIDKLWNQILKDGGQEVECGWITDKFGVSWQIAPIRLDELASGPDREKAKRVMTAMLKMKKLDIAKLEAA